MWKIEIYCGVICILILNILIFLSIVIIPEFFNVILCYHFVTQVEISYNTILCYNFIGF